MIAIDFNQILDFQFQESKRGYKRILSFYFLARAIFSTRFLIKKYNVTLTRQLVNAKGIYVYLSENVSDLKDKDLSSAILNVEGIIKETSAFEAYLENHLSATKLQELNTTHTITKEILDVTYNLLRLLKKNNLKTPMAEASEEAKIAVGHSTNTLNKIFHGR
ncbi:hypothetical protein [Chitinophaga sp.]|uniref:hypothetical protein n=1 Tax=Chitinophaga sp. TaxID=1869181 RepID=UPI0031D31647